MDARSIWNSVARLRCSFVATVVSMSMQFGLSSCMSTLYTSWDSRVSYRTESVDFLGLMNSATKLGFRVLRAALNTTKGETACEKESARTSAHVSALTSSTEALLKLCFAVRCAQHRLSQDQSPHTRCGLGWESCTCHVLCTKSPRRSS